MQHRKRNEVYEEEEQQQQPGTIDLPQAFPDDGPINRKVKVEERQQRNTRKPRRRTDSETSRGNNTRWVITFSLLMIVVLVASYFLVAEHEKEQIEHAREDIIHQQVEPLSREWEEKYAKLEEENEQFKAHESDYARMKTKTEKLLENESKQKDVVEKQEGKIEYYKKYQKEIQQRIKLMSRALLVEKFGEGPHHIEITLAFVPEFPKKDDTDTEQQRIVIELAPIDEMPHVVYWFLEQVTRGLYDGCSFHRNAGHVLQGGPNPNFLSPPDPQLHKRFRRAGFYSVLFQEYSPNFRHEKYTLGLAGRPGGPDFYVSTRNNTRLHGPGGQTSYDDPSEADPCFAKVIEGFNVVERMQLGPVKPGGYKAFTNNVAIVSMKLLGSEAIPRDPNQ